MQIGWGDAHGFSRFSTLAQYISDLYQPINKCRYDNMCKKGKGVMFILLVDFAHAYNNGKRHVIHILT